MLIYLKSYKPIDGMPKKLKPHNKAKKSSINGTISIDLDGIIANSAQRVLELFIEEGGLPINLADITEYNFPKYLKYPNGKHISNKHLRELFKKAWQKPEKLELTDKKIKNILNGSFKGWYIRVLTSTQGKKKDVLKFLKMNKLLFHELTIVDAEKDKIYLAGDIHFDDNRETAIAISKKGKHSFLLNTKYAGSSKKLNNRFFIVDDWTHFGKMVESRRI